MENPIRRPIVLAQAKHQYNGRQKYKKRTSLGTGERTDQATTRLESRLSSIVKFRLQDAFFLNRQSYGIEECSPELNGDYHTNLISSGLKPESLRQNERIR